ncbi:MAG: amidohydrolase family protein, partial [Chthoniobacteraceae bacterium]
CKLSGMVTEADHGSWTPDDLRPYLDVVFEAFGVERLMWGSDWPVCLLAGRYEQVHAVVEEYTRSLGSEAQEAIFGGNAVSFYLSGS